MSFVELVTRQTVYLIKHIVTLFDYISTDPMACLFNVVVGKLTCFVLLFLEFVLDLFISLATLIVVKCVVAFCGCVKRQENANYYD